MLELWHQWASDQRLQATKKSSDDKSVSNGNASQKSISLVVSVLLFIKKKKLIGSFPLICDLSGVLVQSFLMSIIKIYFSAAKLVQNKNFLPEI